MNNMIGINSYVHTCTQISGGRGGVASGRGGVAAGRGGVAAGRGGVAAGRCGVAAGRCSVVERLNRENPGSNPLAVVSKFDHFFHPTCHSSLNCINEYLAADRGGYI